MKLTYQCAALPTEFKPFGRVFGRLSFRTCGNHVHNCDGLSSALNLSSEVHEYEFSYIHFQMLINYNNKYFLNLVV